MRNFLWLMVLFFSGFALGTNLMAYTTEQNKEYLIEKWTAEMNDAREQS